MGMQNGNGRGVVAEINVTPMVDVMLVLLIIFMVITPLLNDKIIVKVPKTKYAEMDKKIVRDTAVVLSIPVEGKYYIGTNSISREDIPERVRVLLKDRPASDQIVYIKSGQTVKYGTVVQAIESIRTAGFDRIGLVSDNERKKKGSSEQAN